MISKFSHIVSSALLLVFFATSQSASASSATTTDPAEYNSVTINGKSIGLQSLWIHSPATSNQLNVENFNNTIYTSLAATSSAVFVSYCSPSNGVNYLLQFDAMTGNYERRIDVTGLPAVSVPLSDIFVDDSGNLCGCSKAFDGEAENDGKLYVYEIGASGAVGSLHELSVSNKNESVGSCRIVGDIHSDNFHTWAAGVVGSDIRIMYWQKPTSKVTAYATEILADNDYNVVEPIDDAHLYLSTKGNKLLKVTIGEGDEISTSVVNGSVSQNCGMAHFDVSSVEMLTYVSSCSRTADVKFSVIAMNGAGCAIWTFPEAGLGYLSSCPSSIANVCAVRVSDHESRLFVYSAAIGLAAYAVYDVNEGGVEVVGDTDGWRIEGNRIVFSEACDAVVYDISGREVKTLRRVNAVAVDDMPEGVYIVRTDDGHIIKIANKAK